MLRSAVTSAPFQIYAIYQADVANKHAEIANQQAEIANRHAEFLNGIGILFVIIAAIGLFYIICLYSIKVQLSLPVVQCTVASLKRYHSDTC